MTEGIRLDQVNIVVSDMEASAAFYAKLGLEFPKRGPAEWLDHHRDAVTDGADVDLDSEEFATAWDAGWPGGPGIVLGFQLQERDHVDRLYAELVADGHTGQQAPYDAFWGARFAAVSDPDGNTVGLMSPVDAAFRRAPVLPPAHASEGSAVGSSGGSGASGGSDGAGASGGAAS